MESIQDEGRCGVTKADALETEAASQPGAHAVSGHIMNTRAESDPNGWSAHATITTREDGDLVDRAWNRWVDSQ